MATKTKPIFKAIDDSEHDSAAAAERHNKVIRARRKVKDALDELKKVMKEEVLTADGVPFAPAESSTFWYLWPCWGQLPRLQRVYIYPYHVDIDSDDGIVVREYDHERKEYRRYRLSELYVSESKAREALHKSLDERLKELTQEVADRKAEK